MRRLTRGLDPHRYPAIYGAGTDFGRPGICRAPARAPGVEPPCRRARVWRGLKARVPELVDGRQSTPARIIDEAQNLPPELFRDLPAFPGFAPGARDVTAIWLIGRPALAQTLGRAPCAALRSRAQARIRSRPITGRDRFAAPIARALKAAGCPHAPIADPGSGILRQASRGLPRQAGRVPDNALRPAVPRGPNRPPDDLLRLAIAETP